MDAVFSGACRCSERRSAMLRHAIEPFSKLFWEFQVLQSCLGKLVQYNRRCLLQGHS